MSAELSASFDKLKRELQEKDEVIGMLKMKLQVMESFHCSSSSLDALNSFTKKPSNIFLLAEGEPASSVKNDQFPSPKFKALEVTTDGYHRKRHHTDTGIFPLSPSSPNETFHANQPATARRKSLFESFSRLRVPSFIAKEAAKKHQKPGLFGKLVNKLKTHFKRQQPPSAEATLITKSSSSTTPNEDCIQFSYEQIIAGKIPIAQVSIEHIEKYLRWDDCIEVLGVTKEQLKHLRSDSLEFRKRRAFLCADQLLHYPKDT